VVAAESRASDCHLVKSRLCFVGAEDVTGSFGVAHGRAVGNSETAVCRRGMLVRGADDKGVYVLVVIDRFTHE
jgi:hypothetical protein